MSSRRSWLVRSLVAGAAVAWGGARMLEAKERGAGTSTRQKKLKGRYIEHLSWKDAEPLLKAAPVALLPLGARTKEHGLHLPLNNDWVMAEYFAHRVLEEVDVPAFPTLQYGYYPAFVEYPGSVSVAKDTFRDYVADVCRSIARNGPKKIYILNTGFSTQRALEPARQLLAKEGVAMEFTRISELSEAEIKRVRKESEGTHADEIETSMMLYMAPEIVRMKLAARDIHPDKGGSVVLTRDSQAKTGTYSPTGAWGDPTLATREKGRIVVEAHVRDIIEDIRRFAASEWTPVPPRTQWL